MGSYPWLSEFLADARHTVAPPRGAKDGVLPPLLVGLTVVTGLVDAFSYLVLGHVFVANMTGNVVFFAFALAGVGGFSAPASLAAIGCFALGAMVAGRLGRFLAGRRELLLAVAAGIQAVIVAEAVTMAALTSQPIPVGLRYALIVALALAMGVQNGAARKIAVPDLTTTVLTLTITGMAADHAWAGATGARVARRLISVAAMGVGALVGAVFVLHVHIVYPLVIALIILAAVAVTATTSARNARSPHHSPVI
ncbi:MAG: YoaK family protein [Streptosporangiaceae bacterium]